MSNVKLHETYMMQWNYWGINNWTQKFIHIVSRYVPKYIVKWFTQLIGNQILVIGKQ